MLSVNRCCWHFCPLHQCIVHITSRHRTGYHDILAAYLRQCLSLDALDSRQLVLQRSRPILKVILLRF
jgi:hypothetical protein